MKIIILIPVFNDFKSASKLIEEIDINISKLKAEFSVIVVNDASTEEKILKTKNLNNIKSLKLINMRNNKGHARCIAAGLKHISENEETEISIISQFLPKQLTEDETKRICDETIKKVGANSIKDMGKVMGALKKEYSDVLDFSKVSQIIKENLK